MHGDGSIGNGALMPDVVTLETRDERNGAGVHHSGGPPRRRLLSLAEVAAKPVEWVWEGLIPRGKLTLVTGEAGVGKSLFTLQVAAMVTRGLQTPPSSETGATATFSAATSPGAAAALGVAAKQGAVVLFSRDDGLADTVRPRLENAGADLGRVFALPADEDSQSSGDDPPPRGRRHSPGLRRLERDLEWLHENLAELEASGVELRLIVIDPIDAYLTRGDSALNIAAGVNRLVQLAARTGAAVLVVANSTSSRIGRTGYRNETIGTTELASAARTVLTIVQDLECEDQRMVLAVKTNLSQHPSGRAFTIRDGVVEWGTTPVRLTGEEYFVQSREKLRNPLVREECSELHRVTTWLRETLSQGMVSSVAVRQGAYANEIAYSTLRRAFRQLGCQSTKLATGRWFWRLPGVSIGKWPPTEEGSVSGDTS